MDNQLALCARMFSFLL